MKKLSTVKAILLTSILMLPAVVFAQNSVAQTTFGQTATQMGQNVAIGIGSLAGLVEVITQTLVKSLATLFLSAALLAFFYGIVEYIWGKRQGEAKTIKVGNDFMKWGLIALFVMFSVYGIIQLFQGILFNGKDITTITIPNITFKTGTARDVQLGQPQYSAGVDTGAGSSQLGRPQYSGGANSQSPSLGQPQYSGGTGAQAQPQRAITTQSAAQTAFNNCMADSNTTSDQCNQAYQNIMSNVGSSVSGQSTGGCQGDGDCRDGLVCRSNACVKASSASGSSSYSCNPPGAECTPVGGGTGTCNSTGDFCTPDASSGGSNYNNAVWGSPTTDTTGGGTTASGSACVYDEATDAVNCSK